MTLYETPRFMTPRVSIYDLLSAMKYRGPINSTKLLISRSEFQNRAHVKQKIEKQVSTSAALGGTWVTIVLAAF